MEETVQKLLAFGKGILAADESTKTITKRFASVGLISTPELNKKYREMLFLTPGIEEVISGVILYEETLNQGLNKILEEKKIIPGIKVDQGLEPFNGGKEEVTKGLNDLENRLNQYSSQGVKFTKWRGVFKISDIYPSDSFLEENLNRMVQYVLASHKRGLLAIPEPEILLDGKHTTTRCAEVANVVLRGLFEKMKASQINLKRVILKTSMVLPGKESGVKAAPFEVAQATLRLLKETIPFEIPGIVFLSGGQTPDEATYNLNEIVKLKGDVPWQISFSFARALQEEALLAWRAQDENVKAAQEAFLKRLLLVSKARKGEL